MNINKNDFFHQATIRLCGSLDIRQALKRSFQYLKDYIPMDHIRMGRYDQDLGAIRLIVEANESGAKKIDMIVPLPQFARDHIENQPLLPAIKIVSGAEEDQAQRFFLEVFGKVDASVMLLDLVMDNAQIGAVIVSKSGKNHYTDEHSRLLLFLHDPFSIALANTLRHAEVLKLKDMLTDDNRYLTRELHQMAGDEIVGGGLGLKDVMDMVQQVAPRDNPVLLLGETGVGKEVIANAIHHSSSRKDGPFIKLNCGAIPENLVDSELFGHEKGAFTGAVSQKRGRFERANGGTIFLDEIGDLPLQAQTRLLRVIQQKEFERVGGTKTILVDTRIITATHRNLPQMVKNKKFREDLWYRLNIFPIIIPPLRQRKQDIPELVGHFLKRKSRELNYHDIPPIAPHAIDKLMGFYWKGNVRELENVVERALIQFKGGMLNFDPFIHIQEDETPTLYDANGRILSLDEVIARQIQFVLETTHGKINGTGGAAELLGIHPSTLRHKMDHYRIPYGKKHKRVVGRRAGRHPSDRRF